jgi:2-oxoglutarate ferredoxin oxidoreductase subunit beta
MTATINRFDNDFPIAWCPGCGNFPILSALKQTLVDMELEPHKLILVSGIGQAAKLPHYMRCNFFNGLHGRALPVATAIRIANTDLPVIVIGGDGDTYGEGGNHFLHAIRRNVNLTLITHNNQVFGLTRGQASPTTERGFVTKVQTHGVFLTPLNPLAVALAFEAPFVARGFAGDGKHMAGLFKEAIGAEGFSLVDVLQPCVSFDHVHTFQWYKERVYDLKETKHDASDLMAAIHKVREWGDRIPIGVFYRNPKKPTFEAQSPALQAGPLVARRPDLSRLSGVLDSFL